MKAGQLIHRIAADQSVRVTLGVNGKSCRAQTDTRTTLADFLRHALGLTGTHVGCEHGVCGACTVRVDGVAQRSCLTLAVQAEGSAVQTVEGLAGVDEALTDLQAAFKRHHALQCGFCTAGILLSCEDYLGRNPRPSEAQVRDMLSGHLCRCTGYSGMVQAVLEVAQQRQQPHPETHHA